MALIPVDGRQIATIVTHLEMSQRPKPKPVVTTPLRMKRWNEPELKKYRILFRRVGEPWLWFSRLVLNDDELRTVIHDDQVHIYAICDPKAIEVGLLELDFRKARECTIAFLGLVPQLTGLGLGEWLMSQALMIGWRKGVDKMKVQTCTLDDSRALPLYVKAGFRPVRRMVETFDDPRLLGLFGKEAAPHIPLIG